MDSLAQSLVGLRLSARLPNQDVRSKTDAFAVVYLASGPPGGRAAEIGRTEVVYDQQLIVFTYMFEAGQTLIIRLYDEDRKGVADLRHHKYIGEASVSVGALMCSRGQQKTIPITTKLGSAASLTIEAEELATCDWQHAVFSGKKLVNKDGPFGMSAVIMGSPGPVWEESKISVQNMLNMCNGDYDRPLRQEVYDWDRNVRDPFPVDYMMKLLVAIDFTGSNGSPDQPTSLRYLDRTGQRLLTQYQQASLAIGNIHKDYSSDGVFSVFGLGACLPDFPVTFADPRVVGVEGIMGAYMNALPQVRLMITDGEINDMEDTIATTCSNDCSVDYHPLPHVDAQAHGTPSSCAYDRHTRSGKRHGMPAIRTRTGNLSASIMILVILAIMEGTLVAGLGDIQPPESSSHQGDDPVSKATNFVRNLTSLVMALKDLVVVLLSIAMLLRPLNVGPGEAPAAAPGEAA